MDFSVIRVADTGSLYNGITAVLRHTAAVSLDPANKQRDDGCQASTPMMSSQCLTLGWLCCIASYDGLKIKKMENISSLLFWYL
ncbi:hypothetical protein [Wolbachia endosymbiont (group A) of Rhinocyllus conicus]|uniref:hypothetical protein n=1 Tax=Wolbachia endosymbiont (group A) of Rhinocyllus conicus TaxID=2954053 RepID=UPI0022270892|nr:hypothetical protein [Wolbachia endosymbiont (group A) of Rhinocyllus conicus]